MYVMCMYKCTYVCIKVCMYVCMYSCMYVADEGDQCYIFCIYIVYMCLGILGGWQ